MVTVRRSAGRPGQASLISSGSSVASRASRAWERPRVTSRTRTRRGGPGRRLRRTRAAYICRVDGRRSEDSDDGWTSAVSSGFALAGFLSLVFVAFTFLAMGPFVRYDAYFNLAPPPQEWVPFLHVLDRVGQRAVALPILGFVLYRIYRRTESWRPVVVAACSGFLLNLL